MAQANKLEVEQDGAIGVLRLNRPERANAYDDALLDAMDQALTELLSHVTCRVLLIEASGDRAFCGGADLAAMKRAVPEDALDLRSQAVFDRIARAPIVSVAAIHGPAVAGGFELAMACDLRVAGPAATFSLPETALGLIPSAGGTTRLSRLLGPSRAKSVILGGRTLDAQTALQWGLVDRVVPHPRQQARKWAAQVASRDPMALRLAKAIIDRQETSSGLAWERLSEALLYSRRQGEQ